MNPQRQPDKEKSKVGRFQKRLNKLKHFEDRKKNKQVIDEMIRGQKNQILVPRSGELFVVKTKNYKDESLALKIPLHELLDGTKTAKELKHRYGKKYLRDEISEAREDTTSNLHEIIEKIDDLDQFVDPKYETTLTQDLRQILSLQQRQFLQQSSKVFSDTNSQLQKSSTEANRRVAGRPISAKMLIKKHKNFVLKKRDTGPKSFKLKKANKGSTQTADDISEKSILSRVERNQVDVMAERRNTYLVKNPLRLPNSISGYRNQVLIPEEKQIELEKEQKRLKESPFSPFLMFPMDKKKQEISLGSEQQQNTKFFSLEYFMFPIDADREHLPSKYHQMKDLAQASNPEAKIWGFSKYFDIKGEFEWKKCQLTAFDEDEELFNIRWAHSESCKKVTRSNFFFEGEDRQAFFHMLENAQKWRELCCIYLKYNDLIDRIDTPTNPMPPRTLDTILKLSLDLFYRYGPPRDPLAVAQLSAQERFDFAQQLKNKKTLYVPIDQEEIKAKLVDARARRQQIQLEQTSLHKKEQEQLEMLRKQQTSGLLTDIQKLKEFNEQIYDPPQLNFLDKVDYPQRNFDAVRRFDLMKYSLNTVNRVSDEIRAEFRRANHQIDFHLSLPYSSERQNMFQSYFPKELFRPVQQRHTTETSSVGLPLQIMSSSQYKDTFREMKDSLHQASPHRQDIMRTLSESLLDIDEYCFVQQAFEPDQSYLNFLVNQEHASLECHRRVDDVVERLNKRIDEIVNVKRKEMDEYNREIDNLPPNIRIKYNKKVELDEDVQDMIMRYSRLINFKLEYRLKLLLRRGLECFNGQLRSILIHFETIMDDYVSKKLQEKKDLKTKLRLEEEKRIRLKEEEEAAKAKAKAKKKKKKKDRSKKSQQIEDELNEQLQEEGEVAKVVRVETPNHVTESGLETIKIKDYNQQGQEEDPSEAQKEGLRFDMQMLEYPALLEYSERVQFDETDLTLPSIMLKIKLENRKVTIDSDGKDLQKELLGVIKNNVDILSNMECLRAKDLGSVREARLVRVVIEEFLFIQQREASQKFLTSQIMIMHSVFARRVHDFEFVFGQQLEKMGAKSNIKFSLIKKALLKLKVARTDSQSVFFRDRIRIGLFEIECGEFRTLLAKKVEKMIDMLVKLLIDKIAKENVKLKEDTVQIKQRLAEHVESLPELEKLRNYALDIKNVLEEVMGRITEIMEKLDLVEEMQYKISYEQFSKSWNALAIPNEITEISKTTLMKLEKQEKVLQNRLRDFQAELERDIMAIGGEFDRLCKLTQLTDTENMNLKFQGLGQRIEKALAESKEVNDGERILNQTKLTDYRQLEDVRDNFTPFNDFWQYAANHSFKYLQRFDRQLLELDREAFTSEIINTWNALFQLEKKAFSSNSNMQKLCRKMRDKYSELKPFLPLINDLRNPDLEQRHWQRILQVLNWETDEAEIQKKTLNEFLEKGAKENLDQIRDISDTASKEQTFVRVVDKLKKGWRGRSFSVEPYKESDRLYMVGIDPILDVLDEDIAKLSSILSSPNIKFCEGMIKAERETLIEIQDIIELWIKVQKHWQYLLPIFSSDDIKHKLGDVAQKYENIDKMWKGMLDETKEVPQILERCKKQKLKENLQYCFDTAEGIITRLNEYLDSKRVCFPRFYFLPNEELLMILSQTRDVRMIQRYLAKCFEGIDQLVFTPANVITSMRSARGEQLEFVKEVDPNLENGQIRNVEDWLQEVESQMKAALERDFVQALAEFLPENKDNWVFQWASQVVIAISQTLWTHEVEEAILHQMEEPKALKNLLKSQTDKLMSIVETVQKNKAGCAKDVQTLEVLIILEVHGQRVIEDLCKGGVSSVQEFGWVSQLRYYQLKKEGLTAKMVNTERQYGWEYLGNQGRLVITPLTDRCYRTLMSALQMNLGGAPEGPAGTGKTETTKDLAKALAKQCVVFNCSDELDIGQMSKFFMGLTSCGSWACFDEFNRIELEVLSVIAQQILCIQTSIIKDQAQRYPSFQFEFNGSTVKLDPTCAIFITMNPGYAGRSELPDNLKRLFRSIAMMIPNFSMIAEISLYSYGFQEARNYSIKICQSLTLSSEQLSTQSHYDFGMRSVKAILVAAGSLKRQFPDAPEGELVIRAICDCTLPKFTSEDTALFQNILSDLFPGEEAVSFDYEDLKQGLSTVARESHLQMQGAFEHKIIQLYETIRVRHGLMLVGDTLSGKTSVMNILRKGWQLAAGVAVHRTRLLRNLAPQVLAFQKKKISPDLQAFSMFQNRKTGMGTSASIGRPSLGGSSNLVTSMHGSEEASSSSESENEEKLENQYQEVFRQLDVQYQIMLAQKVHQDLNFASSTEIGQASNKGTLISIDRLNPKAISVQQMFGETDENSGDWKEGITAKIFKQCVDDESGALRWIVFDGPVDANWIENMNTVLDDNKKLCLANSEQIKITDKMSIVFEVEDLAEASLATVSRCGMIYMEREGLPIKALYEKWYLDLPPTFRSEKHKELFDQVYEFIFLYSLDTVKDLRTFYPINNHHLLINTLKIFESFFFKNKSRNDISREIQLREEKEIAKRKQAEMLGEEAAPAEPRYKSKKNRMAEPVDKNQVQEIFTGAIYAAVWGIGSVLMDSSRETFSTLLGSEVRTCLYTNFKGVIKESYPPDNTEDSLFDWYYAFDTKNWQPFVRHLQENSLDPDEEVSFGQIFIPTKDSIRNQKLLDMMIKQQHPLLFFGKTGTGKTQVVKETMLQKLPAEKYIPLITVLSANTQHGQLQEVLESKLEKHRREKGVYGPVVGKKNVIFVDDLNMPKKELYGAQPPLELLRQWFDEEGWYDKKDLVFKRIVDVQFVSGMGLGRPDVPRRLFRHFVIQSVFEYDKDTISHVFGSIFQHFYHRANETLRSSISSLTNICVRVYEKTCSTFLPLPGRSHYLFNLRDLSKMVQGVSAVPVEVLQKQKALYSYLARLVLSEASTVFSNRFVSEEDTLKFRGIVQDAISKYFKKSFKELVPDNTFFAFGNFMDMHAAAKTHQEIPDEAKLRDTVEAYILEYNELYKKKIDILLFEQALLKLLEYNNILSREHGHGLFVGLGGDGRRTLTRLAAYMQDYVVEEPDVQKAVTLVDWQEFLKEAFKKSGVDEKSTVLLLTDAQLDQDFFYEDINNILNIGEVPNLYKTDDSDQIINDMRIKFTKLKKSLGSAALWEAFLSSCKQNLHLVISASAIGSSLRQRMRAFPSLINCSSIVWHLPWSGTSLQKIAVHEVLEKPGCEPELLQGSAEAICHIFVAFHASVLEKLKSFKRDTGKHYYVTPINYSALISTFKSLLGTKKQGLIKAREKYLNGVLKLNECEAFVAKNEKDLEVMKPKQQRMAEEVSAKLKVVKIKRSEAEDTRAVVFEQREVAEHKQEVALGIKAQCDEKLEAAKPQQAKAQNELNKLKSEQFVEMSSYTKPPPKALIIFQGVLRLIGIKPKKKSKSEKFFEDKFKKMMKEHSKTLQRLRAFKVEESEAITIKELEEFIAQNDAVFARSYQVSKMVGVLSDWVIANIGYYKVYNTILPLRRDLRQAEESLEEANATVAARVKELEEVEAKLGQLEQSYNDTISKKNQLEKQIRECSIRLDRSLKLKNGLSGERGRWEGAAADLLVEIDNVLGDILLGSAFIAYMGPFNLEYRKLVLKDWIEIVQSHGIVCSGTGFSLLNLVGDPVKVQEWNLAGLPFDETSIENMLIIKQRPQTVPLVVDPQQQFLGFIKRYEKQDLALVPKGQKPQETIELKANVPRLERKVDHAMRAGAIMILQNLGQEVHSCFDHLLEGDVSITGGIKYVQVGQDSVPMDDRFKLYLISNLNTPHFMPSTLTKVNYLDFSVTPGGLQEQMLSVVCRREKPKDEEEKIQIMQDSTKNRQTQKELENEILIMLSGSSNDFVENDQLINSLTRSKESSHEIQVRLEMSEVTREKIERNRSNYKALAVLTTQIYFIIKELYKWDPMYQFSLQWFEEIFVRSIKETEKGDPKNVEKRVNDLREAILERSFREICRSLFVRHKQLFAFLLATTAQRCEGQMDDGLLELILREKLAVVIANPKINEEEHEGTPKEGQLEVVAESEEYVEMENPVPNVLSDKVWTKVQELGRHPDFRSLRVFVSNHSDYFMQMLDTLEEKDLYSEESWPEGLIDTFSMLGALSFVKLFRSDLFVGYMKRYIAETIGDPFIENVVISLEDSFKESEASQPLLYVLGPGDDPHEELKKFAQEKNVYVMPISLGKGQGEQAKAIIEEQSQKNCWVLLQNCHLAISWLPELEILIEKLGSPSFAKKLSGHFRLFLTASTTPVFPLSILQDSIKMTKDPPKGIQANIRQVYLNQNSTKIEQQFFEDVPASKIDDWRSLYMSLAFFHAVVRERRRYGPVGWNQPYDFNESDFKISVKQLKHAMKTHEEIPFKALHYLTSECFYGGKVTEQMDRRLLVEMLSVFYNPDVIDDKYTFSEVEEYFIPKQALDIPDALDFIDRLPNKETPELYGLHPNAAISSAIQETKTMVTNILLIQSNASGSQDPEAVNLELKTTCRSFLKRMPEPFVIEEVKTRNPLSYENCMNTVLLQEILRYNGLIHQIRSTLTTTIKACEGTVVMTSELEIFGYQVRMNVIPDLWKKKSYPSLKPLASYVDDLLKRLEMFKRWAFDKAPFAFWLPGFFFTQSFFTGVLQQYARENKISIDALQFDHQVQSDYFEATKVPEEGCLIFGLFLEAGKWNEEKGCLGESRHKEIYSKMPMVQFVPRRTSDIEQEEQPEPASELEAQLQFTQSGNDLAKSPSKKQQYYECPLYKTAQRYGTLSTTGHSTNFILKILLKTEVAPSHWIKRGTALLTQIND